MEGTRKMKQLEEMLWGKTKKKSDDKCPPTMRNKTRKRWWGDKIIGECFCCGRIVAFEDAQVGRIQAGGEYTPENSRLVCGECNRGMGKTNMKIYMKRNYPERYQKYFPKETKIVKKTRKKKPKTKVYNPFEIKVPKLKI